MKNDKLIADRCSLLIDDQFSQYSLAGLMF